MPMSLVELRTYYDRFEAEIVCGRLRSEGLDALLFDVGLAATHGALPVRVMVLEEDRKAALDIIARDADD
jgi:hypothetical protein